MYMWRIHMETGPRRVEQTIAGTAQIRCDPYIPRRFHSRLTAESWDSVKTSRFPILLIVKHFQTFFTTTKNKTRKCLSTWFSEVSRTNRISSACKSNISCVWKHVCGSVLIMCFIFWSSACILVWHLASSSHLPGTPLSQTPIPPPALKHSATAWRRQKRGCMSIHNWVLNNLSRFDSEYRWWFSIHNIIRHDLIIRIIFHNYLCDVHHLCDFPWFALVGINELI